MSGVVAWDDEEGWRLAGLRKDGVALSERGRRIKSAIAHRAALRGAVAIVQAVAAAPRREDAAYILAMALARLAPDMPNEWAVALVHCAVGKCFDEAYPERKAKAA